jgi:hypothetical protein
MATGKWRQEGVPHRGWSVIDSDDLGAPDMICQMCEVQHIRYTHKMYHPDYHKTLMAGVICAENMSGDYKTARANEKELKRNSRRKKKTVFEARTAVSITGWVEPYRITVSEDRQRWVNQVIAKMRRRVFVNSWSYRAWLSHEKDNQEDYT